MDFKIFIVLYSHIINMHIYTYTYRIHMDAMNKRRAKTSLKKYTSHFIWKVCAWEGVGDRTELQHIDTHSYSHQSCVFLVLKSCSTGGPEAHSAGCGLSLPHLVTNGSPNSLTSCLHRVQSSTQYLSITGHRDVSLLLSLECHVWLSSNGNNCHAVHRSLSPGASVYDCTMGFYLVPYCQPSPPTRFLPITAIG